MCGRIPMIDYGNHWVATVANLIEATPRNVTGLIYYTREGRLLLCENESEAPDGADYVAQLRADTDPMKLAAMLRHVASLHA